MKATRVQVLRCAGVAAMAAFGAAGCVVGDVGGPQGETGALELFSWWSSASESRALEALIAIYEGDHPGTGVYNAAATEAATTEARLQQRMTAGLPPDTFQVHGGVKLRSWVEYNGQRHASKLEPLDEIAASSGWLSSVPEPIVEAVTHGGHVYAVPVNIHRSNCLLYNKRIFEETGLAPPTTLRALKAVSNKLAAKGVTPLSVAGKHSSWLGAVLWEHLFLMSAGPRRYESFFRGELDPEGPQVRAALKASLEVFEHVNEDYERLLWPDAVRRVGSGEAAMTMAGDWAKAELQAQGYALDEDFGMVTVGEGAFVYLVESFALPKGSERRDAALALLATMGTVEGQDALNPLKGSIPARTDGDRSLYDALSRQAMDDARDPETLFVPERNVIAPSDFSVPVNDAYKVFLRDGDIDRMLHTIKAHYDVLGAARVPR
ncbi:ABC transporter substrate-binding protein [Sorangium sp. So ce134]